jgi:hypothetical protein
MNSCERLKNEIVATAKAWAQAKRRWNSAQDKADESPSTVEQEMAGGVE